MNKKGDVSMTILVIIALAASAAVAFAFITYNGTIGNGTNDMRDCISETGFAVNYIQSEAALLGEESIKKGRDIKSNFILLAKEREDQFSYLGNFYGEVRNGNFEFSDTGDLYVLKFEKLFVSSERGQNQVKINFNFNVTFSRDGNLQKIYKD